MANIKASIKDIRQSQKRAAQNRIYRGGARTAIKKAQSNINSDADNAQDSVRAALRALDIAARKGVIHKNNAARRKSRLMLQLNRATAA